MNFKALLALTILATTPAVLAHQNLHEIYIDGVSQGAEVCLRQPPSNSPVTDIMSTDIRCNVGGQTAKAGVKICSARAGSTITVRWDTSSHPGPITHMLSGPYTDINSANGAEWVKIDEANLINGEFANIYMMANGGKYSFKLPANLASGDYLLRSEMLALHGAQTVGGGQFYIGCAHLRITGPGGNCSPKIQLPGAYSPTERAIYIPNVYNGFQSTTYKAPGGPVATCTGGSGPQPTPITPVVTVRPTTVLTTISTTTTSRSTTVAVPAPTGAGVQKYGQCGGIGYTGPTNCVAGSTCTKSNDYYSQCL